MSANTGLSIESGKPTGVTALRDFLWLASKTCVLLAAVATSVLAIVILIPDGTDYPQVTVKKHQRLAEYDTRRIVLVGGSNLPFGIDSTMIRQVTGCPVVNMGMNGYLGVRYMLEEVKAGLKPTDVVVLSFEWDNFYKSVEGNTPDLFAIVKANPAAFNYLSSEQKMRVITAFPRVMQQKSMRVISETLSSIKKRVTGEGEDPESALGRLFWRVLLDPAGTSPDGDLISHLNIVWPKPILQGLIPADAKVEAQMISMMRDFTEEMANRSVTVLVSYSPIERKYYAQHEKSIADAHAMISGTAPLVAPSPPAAFVYDERYFFDTVYHLNPEGRILRTQKLIDDLRSRLPAAVDCRKSLTVVSAR